MVRRALVVDDSKSVRMMVVYMLRRGGFEVVDAESAADGLRQLDTVPVDLVITDLNMPGMDGLQFIRAVRARPTGGALPALLMTTNPAESMEQARAAGASGCLVKPIRLDDLLHTINRLLPE